jgi:hypothetical protein
VRVVHRSAITNATTQQQTCPTKLLPPFTRPITSTAGSSALLPKHQTLHLVLPKHQTLHLQQQLPLPQVSRGTSNQSPIANVNHQVGKAAQWPSCQSKLLLSNQDALAGICSISRQYLRDPIALDWPTAPSKISTCVQALCSLHAYRNLMAASRHSPSHTLATRWEVIGQRKKDSHPLDHHHSTHTYS